MEHFQRSDAVERVEKITPPDLFMPKMTKARKCRSSTVTTQKQDISPSPALVWSCLSPATSPYQGPSWAEMYQAKFGHGFRQLQTITAQDDKHQIERHDNHPVCKLKEHVSCSVNTYVDSGARNDAVERVAETTADKEPSKVKKASATNVRKCRSSTTSDKEPHKFAPKMKKASPTNARKCRSSTVTSRKQYISPSPALVWSCLSPATSPHQSPSWAEMYDAKFGNGFRRLQTIPTQDAKQRQIQKHDDHPVCELEEQISSSVKTHADSGVKRNDALDILERVAETTSDMKLNKITPNMKRASAPNARNCRSSTTSDEKLPKFTPKMKKASATNARKCRSSTVTSRKQDISPSPALVWSCLSPATSPYQGPSWTEMYQAKFGNGFRGLQNKQDHKRHHVHDHDDQPVQEQTEEEQKISTQSTDELPSNKCWMENMLGKSWKTKLAVAGGIVALVGIGWMAARKCRS